MTDAASILNRLIQKKDLSREESRAFLDSVIAGDMTPAQIGAVLTALRMKGETSEEIEGLLLGMRAHMLTADAPGAIDIVGTGGDGSGTFNISTAAAFVAAGAGAKIAKHGNRAASSTCGSADVLQALGVNIQLSPEQAAEVYKKAGIVFLLAPLYHSALKNVVAVRKELKIRTIFNVLGPFANPAGAKREVIGVPNVDIAKTMATVALSLGYEHVVIVTSDDGMDEISTSAKTQTFEVRGGKIKRSVIDPATLGFKKADKKELLGGSSEKNAQIIRDILDGKKGPTRDVVVLNSAFALLVAGIVKTPAEGVVKAAESIDSGKAAAALEALVRETQKFKRYDPVVKCAFGLNKL